jgi:hypothetical protein
MAVISACSTNFGISIAIYGLVALVAALMLVGIPCSSPG